MYFGKTYLSMQVLNLLSSKNELSQPTNHANKIIILIFLIMKATILDTHSRIGNSSSNNVKVLKSSFLSRTQNKLENKTCQNKQFVTISFVTLNLRDTNLNTSDVMRILITFFTGWATIGVMVILT